MTTTTYHPPREENSRLLSHSLAAWTVLALWGAGVATLAANSVFHSSPEKPPLAILVAALGPGVVFLAAYASIGALRDWVARLSIEELIALQGWRVIGFAFLAGWALGDLPAVFALPAGLGDIAVGFAAPAVAVAAAQKRTGWKLRAWLLTAAGLFDFIVAFATGILSRDGSALHVDGAVPSTLLGLLPFVLFPAFIVPAFMIIHLMTIIRLRTH